MKRGYAALFDERLKFLSLFEFILRCPERVGSPRRFDPVKRDFSFATTSSGEFKFHM
jgi:hypothetical protein